MRCALLGEPTGWHVGRLAAALGSRGHGPVETTLLGSTSSAVVDHATNPVLIARGDRVTRAILAEDGSPGARNAETLILRWPPGDVTLSAVGGSFRAGAGRP